MMGGMNSYAATATFSRSLARLGADVLPSLDDYAPRASADAGGAARVTITVPADNLGQAVRTAEAVFAPHRPAGLEVIPSAMAARRAAGVPVPELLSVTEAADRLGVTRQAVLQRVEAGTLAATRIGNAWAVPAATLPA